VYRRHCEWHAVTCNSGQGAPDALHPCRCQSQAVGGFEVDQVLQVASGRVVDVGVASTRRVLPARRVGRSMPVSARSVAGSRRRRRAGRRSARRGRRTSHVAAGRHRRATARLALARPARCPPRPQRRPL